MTNSAVFSKECCMEKSSTVIHLMFTHANTAVVLYMDQCIAIYKCIILWDFILYSVSLQWVCYVCMFSLGDSGTPVDRVANNNSSTDDNKVLDVKKEDYIKCTTGEYKSCCEMI